MNAVTPYTLVLFACLLAFALAFILTEGARRAALRWGVLSHVTARSSHTTPTPRLGGVGLALGFGLSSAAYLLALRIHRSEWMPFHAVLIGWLALGWGLMFLVGLLDDVMDLPPLAKLALMVLAALSPTLGGRLIFESPAFPAPGWLAFLLGLGFALFWILFFTNAYNFMDGMDGFAASFAALSAFFFFVGTLIHGALSASLSQLRPEAFLLPLLAAACLGFLVWNRPPARVFMGDAGSLSVGYLLSVYVILGQGGVLGVRLSPVSSLTVLMPFVFDVILTLVRRARRGENLLQAHREHLYQRLMRSGLSHREVLLINIRRFLLCGVASLTGPLFRSPLAAWLGAATAFAIMLDYWRLTLHCEKLKSK